MRTQEGETSKSSRCGVIEYREKGARNLKKYIEESAFSLFVHRYGGTDRSFLDHPRGGIVVDDNLQSSAPDVFAIGEYTSWKGILVDVRAITGKRLI